MKKTKSILAIIMIMIVTLIGFSSCNNKKCKDGEKCEKEKCENAADSGKCSKKDTASCCMKDKKMDTVSTKECCKKDSKKH